MPLNLGSFISFDPTKIDKLALRKWLVQGAGLLEPAVITPGNFDKLFFDNLDSLIEKLINQAAQENGVLVVGTAGEISISGEHEVTQGELSTYLATFTNAPQESQDILRKNPKLVRRLQKFSKEDQQMIVGNPFLLMALQVLLPIIFQFLMNRFKN